MITKQAVRKNLLAQFGNEIRLHQLDEEKMLEFVKDQIFAYCKPKCLSCYDKGYSKQFSDLSHSSTNILYCVCESGQELKHLIEENYIPKI